MSAGSVAPASDAAHKSLGDRMEFPPTDHVTDWADDVAIDQADGASAEQMGGSLLEPEFDVDVKLNDLQADPNNPLFSAKTFGDLNL